MAADSRLFFKLVNTFPEHPKTIELSDKAFRQLIEAWCYCSRNLNDGKLTKSLFLKLFSAKSRKEVLQVGFVVETENGYEMHDYAKHQMTAHEVETLKKTRSEAGRAGGKARAEKLAKAKASASDVPEQTASKPVADIDVDEDVDEEQKTSSSDAAASDPEVDESAPEFSEEVKDLCEYLAERIKGNGNKAPAKIGVRWMQAADRLIRIDGYTPDQIRQVIDWSQRDEFWQGNILSMPKLREKFDQLKSKMFSDRARAQQQPEMNKSMQRMQGNVAMLRGLQTAPQVDPFEQKALGA